MHVAVGRVSVFSVFVVIVSAKTCQVVLFFVAVLFFRRRRRRRWLIAAGNVLAVPSWSTVAWLNCLNFGWQNGRMQIEASSKRMTNFRSGWAIGHILPISALTNSYPLFPPIHRRLSRPSCPPSSQTNNQLIR